MKGPGEARTVIGMNGLEDFTSRHQNKKDPLLGHGNQYPKGMAKAGGPVPGEEYTRPESLRVRKTIQNKRINLRATDSDGRNQHRRHTSGEVSPRQRCHCSSILVSLRKDVDAVTAEYRGY